MKIGTPVLSYRDLVEIKRTPGVRVSSTPFGIYGARTYYIGSSVPWKGIRGIEGVRAINPRVAGGLEKARALSMSHREKGVSLVRKAGAVILVPTKVAQMMREAGTGEIVANYLSSAQALASLITPAIPVMASR